MSRMRQVPMTDIVQRDRAVHQTLTHTAQRNAAPTYRARSRKPTLSRLRLNDAPSLLSNGCHSVRTFCNNVQNITVDLNNLIGSVESLLPLLTTYLTAIQARTAITEKQTVEPPIDVSVSAPPSESADSISARPTETTTQTMSAPTAPPIMPRPEDLQQLLENPLVKNLLNNFLQNANS